MHHRPKLTVIQVDDHPGSLKALESTLANFPDANIEQAESFFSGYSGTLF